MKKIVLNVPQELSKDETSNDTTSSTTATPGSFGLIEPVVQPVEVQEVAVQEDNQPNQFITADELKENRLTQDGMENTREHSLRKKALAPFPYDTSFLCHRLYTCTGCVCIYTMYVPTDLSSHPVFRNYSRGDPTTRLYIKNLAKSVTEQVSTIVALWFSLNSVATQDLTFIYGRYIDYSSEVHTTMYATLVPTYDT